METYTEKDLEGKSLHDIFDIFFECYNNYNSCVEELCDIENNENEYCKQCGGSCEDAVKCAYFSLDNAEEMMRYSFHRLCSLYAFSHGEYDKDADETKASLFSDVIGYSFRFSEFVETNEGTIFFVNHLEEVNDEKLTPHEMKMIATILQNN